MEINELKKIHLKFDSGGSLLTPQKKVFFAVVSTQFSEKSHLNVLVWGVQMVRSSYSYVALAMVECTQLSYRPGLVDCCISSVSCRCYLAGMPTPLRLGGFLRSPLRSLKWCFFKAIYTLRIRRYRCGILSLKLFWLLFFCFFLLIHSYLQYILLLEETKFRRWISLAILPETFPSSVGDVFQVPFLKPRMQNPPRAILLENVVGFVPWLWNIRRYHKVAIWILRTNHRKPILKFRPWLTFPSHSWPLDPLTLTLTTTTTHGQPPGTVRMSSTFVECLEYLGDGGVCHWSWRFGSRGWSDWKGDVFGDTQIVRDMIWNTRPWVSFLGRLGLFSGAIFAISLKNVNTPQSLKIAASKFWTKQMGN